MIKVSVLYPAGAETAFDMDYYCKTHMPLVQRLCGAACKGFSVERGVAGGAPGSHAPYVAAGHLLFDSVESFQSSFGPNTPAIMADIPNYTKIQPVVQIGEVVI
ncbi:MAG: EthD family reductase [Vulcanimicrobiaceae bacterium]